MAAVVDVEQLVLLLELKPPFGKKEVQSARRLMAKRWHPDLAPTGREFEHERHLKAINEAADQLEQLAEESRGGKVSATAVKVAGQAARRARAEEGRRNYEAQQRAAEQDADRQQNDPFGSRMPDHSVVHRYARCLSYPEWGVGTVDGIYFTGDGDHVQQWARVRFHDGIRTVPAGSLQFVDFSRPDPAADRVERFMTAARHALAENDFATAAQRLTYARDAQPRNPVVLRLITFAFWQAGNLAAAGRAVRDWIRVEPGRPVPQRYASRIYEAMGATDLALSAAEEAATLAPNDASGWERVGRLRLARFDRRGAIEVLERARALGATVEGLLDLALAHQLAGNVGAAVAAAEQATVVDPESAEAWTRLAYALARTDLVSDALEACRVALARGAGEEIEHLRARLEEIAPRELPAA
ncbi:MAG: tetratricopeptide repeat protein [Patulibacter minatonensis]